MLEVAVEVQKAEPLVQVELVVVEPGQYKVMEAQQRLQIAEVAAVDLVATMLMQVETALLVLLFLPIRLPMLPSLQSPVD